VGVPGAAQHYSPLRLIELLAEVLEADPDQRVREVLGDRYEELEELCRWSRLDRFDRRNANRRLAVRDDRSSEEPDMRIRVQMVIEGDEDVPAEVHQVADLHRGELGTDTLRLQLA